MAGLLDDPIRSGLLRDEAGRLAFSHDLVREAIYEDIPQAVRIAIHREAARTLAAAGASPLSVAPHLSIGAEAGDRDAIAALEAGASEAMTKDPRLGARLLERAVELSGGGREGTALRIDLLRALYWSGQLAKAEQLGEALLREELDPKQDTAVRFTMGLTLSSGNRWMDALVHLDAVDEEAIQPNQRAFVLGYRALVLLPCGQLERAEQEARRALELASGEEEGLTRTLAHHTLSHVDTLLGRRMEGIVHVREGVAQQDSDPTGYARLFPVRISGVIALGADLVDEALRMDREGRRMAEELGTEWAEVPYMATPWVQMYLGEWDETEAGLQGALQQADETGARVAVVASLALLAHIAIHRGELAAAEEHLAGVDEEVATYGPVQFQIHRAMWARALHLEACGDPTGADERLRATTDLMLALGWVGELPDLAPDAVRLALGVGDRDRALAITEAVERLPDQGAIATLRGSVLRCRGLLGGNADALLAAVEAYRQGPRRLDLALACEDAGNVRAGEGDGRALLEEALGIYQAIGADRDADRTSAALRALGVRTGSRGPRRRPKTGWESLTPAEERVAGLAAEGLTNGQIAERLFLSRHTVGTHLRHVFAKLGLSSRVELARSFAGRSG